MRPIKLEITGLQSFSKKQSIDFDELTSLGLFGIFGETGSGKSTILDAIILAIFDEIPRTMGRQGKNIKPCLNQDSDVLEVYLKFALGKDIFEITRVYKKKFNRKGEEKFDQMNPILILNGDIIADTVKNVETKIGEYFGIGVSDFTRSVVLPQGKFSDFLKLKGAEKMTMLENIFDLEKYGTQISEKLKFKNNLLKDKISSLQNQIQGKGDISVEVINNLENDYAEKISSLDSIKTRKESLESIYEETKVIKELTQDIEKYNLSLNNLKLNESTIKKYESDIQNHESALLFKERIEDINRLKSDLESKNTELMKSKEIQTKLDIQNNSLKEEENERTYSLNRVSRELDTLKIDYRELDSLRIGIQLLNNLHYKENQLKDSSILLEEFECQLNKNNNSLKDLKETLMKNEKSKEQLEKIDSNQIERKMEEISNLKNDIERSSALNKRLQDLKTTEENIKNSFNSIDIELENLEILSRNNLAVELAKHLSDGNSCPVCGSIHHPHIATSQSDFDSNKLKTLREDKATIERNLIAVQTQIVHIKDELNSIQNLKDIETLKNLLLEKIEEANSLKDSFNKASIEERKLDEIILTCKNNITHIQGDNNKILESISKVNDKILDIKKQILVEQEKIDTLHLENKSLDYMENRKYILEQMDSQSRELINIKITIDEDLKKIKDQLFENLKKIQESTLTIGRLEENISILTIKLNLDETSLNDEIKAQGFNSVNTILTFILDDVSAIELKKNIETHYNEEIRFKSLMDEALFKLDGKTFSKEKWENLQNDYSQIKEDEKKLNEQITTIKTNLERLKTLIKEAEELLNRISILTKEQDDIVMLQKKMEGKKFVKFLARKKLNYIVYQASKRLQQITRGRYTITVDNNCDFNIVDAFNSNFTRECSTLSGGETFIVSLVLALALSSQLQLKGKIQLEFFFLDEGFGTLDSTLLDRVIEILEEIKWKEKMKIGIISHVEDLKIRIPRRLEVSAAVPGEKGSTIKLI
ncbi:SMC family ATPase [Cetobacterium sp. 8H]|uniref:AAA family ATPase n=1 Tax=Cetobacterium sp. 8H TaxID=2759681 RepID=UPI00163C93B5|nr:SMC family ATPase [Cetobacterium sp. 8H]MBC2850061.1 SMC family ATPase [Cetobacterium sp. 8H]